jgi:hypothetical protein
MVLSESGALPGGVTFTDNHDGTATLTGSVNASTGGVYPLTITADNGVLPNATQNFTLTVREAPAITSASAATFQPGVPTTFTVTTSGFPTNASMLISEAGALPAGITFNDNHDGTATVAGTASGSGTFPIVITAANGVNPAATQNFTISLNTPPQITSVSNAHFKVGVAGTFTVIATGLPTGPSMVLSATGALPNGVTFVDNNDGTATIAGLPAAATGGVYPLVITANNGIAPNASQNFTLTVQQAPAITSATGTIFRVGVSGTFTVTTTGFPANVALSESGALPAGLALTDNGNGTATLAGTPGPGTGGTYPLTITANNGTTPNATQNFTLTVQQSPAITSGNGATFKVGQAGTTFDVTTTGFPAGASMVLSETGALPGGVTFTDHGNGTATFAGTPNPGTGGSYALTIAANNGVTPNASQNFTLTVQQAPAITSAAAATFKVGQAGTTFNVVTTGFPAGAAMAITESGALPSGLTFVDNGNGTATLAGTPGGGSGGSYPLAITANNGVAPNATQNFVLAVQQAPAITSSNAATFQTGQPGTFTITTTGFPAGASMALSKTGALPASVSFTNNNDGTATLTGTPLPADGGSYPLVITANNGVTPNATQNFTLAITRPPAFTSAASATFTPGVAGQTFTVSTTGFPNNAITRTGTLPGGVTFSDNGDNTATIAGTPASGTATGSPYAWVLTANNGISPNATQNFTFNVVCPAMTLDRTGGGSFPSATFNVSYGSGQSVTATGSSATPYAYAVTSGSLPEGLTLSTAGVLSNTAPTATGTFLFTITATDGGGCTSSKLFSIAVSPVVAADAYGSLVDNTQAAITGGTTPTPSTPYVSVAGRLTANDLPASGGVTAAPGTVSTLQGGSVAIAADGTFVYTPPLHSAAAAITSDTFSYTGTSNTGGTATPTTATATVTLTLANRVWYVKNNGAAGNGQSQSPFNTLAAAAAASTANDILFVHFGDGLSTGQNAGIALKDGQRLFGEAAGLTVNSQSLFTAGSRPLITNSGAPAVTVASSTANGIRTNIVVKGVAVSVTGAAHAVDITSANAAALSATVDDVTVAGTANGHGVHIGAGNSSTTTVTVQNSTIISASANGIDAASTAGSMLLALNGNTITATATGINVNGAGGGSATITSFASNTVTPANGGTGVAVASATFDSTPGGAFQTVSGGSTVVGASGNGAGGSGLVLTNVSGDLSFADLDLYADAGTGLRASGPTPYTGSAGLQLTVPAGVSDVEAVGGPAVDLATVKASLPFHSVKSTGSATTGLALNSILGTFSAGSGSAISGLTSATGTSFQVGSSNASITYAGTINASTGKGVDLTNNTGSTISFTGALTLSTGTHVAFNATGGGTVTATDANNVVAAAGAAAVNIANTTIGAADVTFRSVSANGGANGIVLNNTGASGNLVVTGNAGTCVSLASTCTGGTIQNTTGHGISLTSTTGPSFSFMKITNAATSGIFGAQVVDFTLRNSVIDGVNTAHTSGDSNVAFNTVGGGATENNVSGVVTITNNTLTNSYQHGVDIINYNGTISNLLITGNSLSSSNVAAISNGSAVRIQALGGTGNVANVTRADLSNNDITNFPSGAGIQFTGGNSNTGGPAGTYGTIGGGLNRIHITGNRMDGGATRMGTQAIGLLINGKGTGSFNVDGNGTAATPLANTAGHTLTCAAFGNVNIECTINNNHINGNTLSNSSGISVGADIAGGGLNTPTITAVITNNVVANTQGAGIIASISNGGGSATYKIQNNTVAAPTATAIRAGIVVSTNGTTGASLCLNIQNNVSAGATSAGGTVTPGIGLRQEHSPGTSTFNLAQPSGYPTPPPSPGNDTTAAAYVDALNPGSASGTGGFAGQGAYSISGGATFGSCVNP